MKPLLDYLEGLTGKPLNFDEEAIAATYQKSGDKQSLAIKVLSIFGGILASLAFLGFLLLAGLYDSKVGLVLFGTVFIVGAILVSKAYDKIIVDTFSVSFFIIGFSMVGFGFEGFRMSGEAASIAFFFIALVSLSIVRSYMLSFVSVLIASGSILVFIISGKNYQLIHAYVAAMSILTSYFILNEAKLITQSKNINQLYEPLRIGLIFSFLFGLVILGKKGLLPISNDFIWFSGTVIICTIVYTLASLVAVLQIHQKKQKIYIYAISILVLLPTALAPAIGGAVLMLLLCFFVNYKTGFAIAIISLLYFIGQYYYDLHFTLLTKSILLFSSGMLFIILYLFLYRKLTGDEKL
jgi:hypothetical protein